MTGPCGGHRTSGASRWKCAYDRAVTQGQRGGYFDTCLRRFWEHHEADVEHLVDVQ